MDPLSLSLGIAGVLPLIASAVLTSKKYVQTVRSARTSIAALIFELEALGSTVEDLQDLLKGESLKGSAVRFHGSSVLLTCSAACEAKLRALCKTLDQQSKGKARRLLWPFTEKEHQKTIQDIRNFTNWMQFALSVDGCRILSQTSNDVLKLMGQQLEQFNTIQTLEADTLRILDLVQEQKHTIQVNSKRETRREILNWISSLKHHRKHQLIQASRARNTGTWILKKKEFIQWRDGSSPSNVLMCHGIQGSGKTNLASIIIDDLLDSRSSETSPVAFFYFDHQDQSTQGTSAVLCCILRQLLEQLPEIPSPLAELYEKSGHQGQMPLHECERLLTGLVSGHRCAYLVFDGLDESEHRKSFVQSIQNVVRSRRIRMLVTSRPHIRDLIDLSQQHPNLKIEAHEEDLKTYLYQGLEHGGVYDIADQSFVDSLVENLMEGADGMFLLPVLRLRTVLKEPTLGDMEDRIEELSQTLSEAFADTISRIQRLPGSCSRLGMGALMWLSHTTRTLTESELSDVLAIHSVRNAVDIKYRPATKTIIECCQGLATVDVEGYVRLAHYAIQEYLTEHSKDLFPRAKAKIAVTCLRYLAFENFQDGPWPTKKAIKSRMEMYPFLPWAAVNWGRFVRQTETDEEVSSALFAFFSSAAATAVANQVRQCSKGLNKKYWNADECRSFSALHHASRHGLKQATTRLLDSGDYSVNDVTQMGTTAVIQAAAAGHVLMTRDLLARGANPLLCNWYGDALHCAMESNNPGTVRELVGWGMHPNIVRENGRTYLSCAMANDSADAFAALVELGADIVLQSESEPDGHIFFTAVLDGCDKIINLMIKRKWADINMRDPAGLTPVHYAAAAGSRKTVMSLLDAGANINAVDNEGQTVLYYAELRGNKAVARLLLDSGARPSPQTQT
ncbi:hypothetical protein LT330_009157 [Penicillium expansum]|nr:hypothetical protein LT330_009157 [Penicillium expansum]